MDIDINTDNIIVADITTYFSSVKRTDKNNTARDWYDNVGKICSLVEYIICSKELKTILNELYEKIPNETTEPTPADMVQPFYALYKLQTLLLAWNRLNKKETKFEQHNKINDTHIIDELAKQIDSLSANSWSDITFIDEFGEYYDEFNVSDYEVWLKILVNYLLPRISKNGSDNNDDKLFRLPDEFIYTRDLKTDNLKFYDKHTGITYKRTIKGIINNRIIYLLLRNPGQTIKTENFIDNVNITSKEQVKHAIFPIRTKLKEINAPFEIVSKGNNGSYALQEK